MFVIRQHNSVFRIFKLMQEGLLNPHSDATIQMISTGLCILTSKHSTDSFEAASFVGIVESVTEGDVSGVRQLRVSIDFVLFEHDLFGRPNLLVWDRYVIFFIFWS